MSVASNARWTAPRSRFSFPSSCPRAATRRSVSSSASVCACRAVFAAPSTSCQVPSEAKPRSSAVGVPVCSRRRSASTAWDSRKSSSRPGKDVTSAGAVSVRTAQPSHTRWRSVLGRSASKRSLTRLKVSTTTAGLRWGTSSSSSATYSAGP